MSTKQIGVFPDRENKLEFLTKPIRKMFSIMDRYADAHIEDGCFDHAYHYNERATLSMFAGAIWRSSKSNLVLEEFGTAKKWSGGEYKGRRDIWFRVAGRICYGEAKQSWIRFPRQNVLPEPFFEILRDETDAANDAVAESSGEGCPEIGLGILFITPFVHTHQVSCARRNLQLLHNSINEALGPWTEREHMHVLWGRYVRPELLEESGSYEWSNGKSGTCPSLDVLICTRA